MRTQPVKCEPQTSNGSLTRTGNKPNTYYKIRKAS